MVWAKLGIRAHNLPVADDIKLLVHHILKNYSNKTLSEIHLAFDLAICGKLQMQDGESVNCFENFTCLYLSAIMTAYRRWVKVTYAAIKTNMPPVPQRVFTPEEILNGRRADIEAAFQCIKAGRVPVQHQYFKEVLENDKLLQEGESVADFFKRRLVTTQNIYIKQNN